MPEETTDQSTRRYMTKLYIATLFYQLGNALILPIVPYLANNLNANSTQYGLSFTVYYITQFISEDVPHSLSIGSLGLGRISDKYGRRLALSVGHLGLTVCRI